MGQLEYQDIMRLLTTFSLCIIAAAQENIQDDYDQYSIEELMGAGDGVDRGKKKKAAKLAAEQAALDAYNFDYDGRTTSAPTTMTDYNSVDYVTQIYGNGYSNGGSN